MSIQIRNVNKHFGSFQALRNVNLDIASGELHLVTKNNKNAAVTDSQPQPLRIEFQPGQPAIQQSLAAHRHLGFPCRPSRAGGILGLGHRALSAH